MWIEQKSQSKITGFFVPIGAGEESIFPNRFASSCY
jgi:hypothetical protein